VSKRPARKLVVISLSRDEYELLAARARANERDPYQEARFIVTRALPMPDPIDGKTGGQSDDTTAA
jgi:hypothetical protein